MQEEKGREIVYKLREDRENVQLAYYVVGFLPTVT